MREPRSELVGGHWHPLEGAEAGDMARCLLGAWLCCWAQLRKCPLTQEET